MSLQEKLDAFKADFEAVKPPYNVPPAVIETMHRATASLVAISPQSGVNSRKSARHNSVEFPILSDPGNEVAAAFGLRFRLPDYLIELYRQLRNELPAFNGDDSWTLPMPGRFVIGPEGI